MAIVEAMQTWYMSSFLKASANGDLKSSFMRKADTIRYLNSTILRYVLMSYFNKPYSNLRMSHYRLHMGNELWTIL